MNCFKIIVSLTSDTTEQIKVISESTQPKSTNKNVSWQEPDEYVDWDAIDKMLQGQK